MLQWHVFSSLLLKMLLYLIELDFPSSLTNSERAFIHRLTQSLGYVSKSRG
uniref:R3H domain-containing protein n=1 Tax=Sinocyclocheilus rhinocerous TaxID=307959 RepID=A0A673GFF7_9TELE